MSYSAEVFTVMIASPGDVASERAIVRQVLHEWNAIYSKRRGIVLLPAGWETHSSPEMGAPAQEIINEQLLDKCDLLIGVFWTRIGTKTVDHVSGTVEEIERHLAADKPTMLYFSSQPAHPDSIDPDQYAELKKFKESCKDRGLLETYDSHTDFKDKFYRQLQIKLNDHSIFQLPAREGVAIEAVSSSSSSVPVPDLTREAQTVLKEASQGNGTVMLLRHLGGTTLQVNSKNLITDKSRRTIAMWEAAITQLVNQDLLVERGYKGEIFEVSDLGYRVADVIDL